MYVIVRQYQMVLVNKFRETCFVSVANVSLLDIGFCDEHCAVGYFVLLSPVQRRVLVYILVWPRA